MTLETTIQEFIANLQDPALLKSGKELNLHCEVEVNNYIVQIAITTGFPSQILTQFQELAEQSLKQMFPNHQFFFHLKQFIKAHRTQLPGKALRGVKNVIAVASGKGGVGKSTVTVNLAAALTKLGARVGILDADIYGPSIPLMLGVTSPVEISDNFYLPTIAHGMQTMSIGYLTEQGQALIWRGPMLAKSLIQMLDCTLWDELDYLLIDLPPGTGDIQLTLVQKIPLTGAIVVTTPQNVATLDAEKAISMFMKTGVSVIGLVENMSTYLCAHCGHHEAIFGDGGAQALCNEHQYPLLGQLPLNAVIRKHCDDGTPVALSQSKELASPFIHAATNTALELAKMPINYADKFPKIVVE